MLDDVKSGEKKGGRRSVRNSPPVTIEEREAKIMIHILVFTTQDLRITTSSIWHGLNLIRNVSVSKMFTKQWCRVKSLDVLENGYKYSSRPHEEDYSSLRSQHSISHARIQKSYLTPTINRSVWHS